jgi:hypothetical protein
MKFQKNILDFVGWFNSHTEKFRKSQRTKTKVYTNGNLTLKLILFRTNGNVTEGDFCISTATEKKLRAKVILTTRVSKDVAFSSVKNDISPKEIAKLHPFLFSKYDSVEGFTNCDFIITHPLSSHVKVFENGDTIAVLLLERADRNFLQHFPEGRGFTQQNTNYQGGFTIEPIKASLKVIDKSDGKIVSEFINCSPEEANAAVQHNIDKNLAKLIKEFGDF